MAANYSLQGFLTVVASIAAQVDSEGNAKASRSLSVEHSFTTGTGTSGGAADCLYVDQLSCTASQSATTIDVRSKTQAGNAQTIVKPKYIVVKHVSGEGTFALVQGASNPYLGIGLVPIKVDKNHPVAVIPLSVDTTATTAITRIERAVRN